MTDDINAPDDNYEFTTDGAPGEQAFESTAFVGPKGLREGEENAG